MALDTRLKLMMSNSIAREYAAKLGATPLSLAVHAVVPTSVATAPPNGNRVPFLAKDLENPLHIWRATHFGDFVMKVGYERDVGQRGHRCVHALWRIPLS
jgi:hypothetical protein